MRYAQITPFEVCNGKGAGVSLFTQGCHFQCKGCFNKETWNFNGGKEWTEDIENRFFELIDRPYIKRVTILGGEPLANENVFDVYNLIIKIKDKFPDKSIWLYTGFKWEHIFHPVITDNFNPERDKILDHRRMIVEICNVLIDGRFVEGLKDLTLKFCGSSNQRVIDVQETLKQGKIITI